MSMPISAMPAGCWDLNLATGTLTLCRQSRTMFGLGPDSSGRLTESEWANRLHPDDLTTVRDGIAACLAHQTPYAERFRTIHPDGSVQLVLGVGRPIEDGGKHCRFVGWNFDVVSAGRMAGEWIAAHPEALNAEHLFSVRPFGPPSDEASSDLVPAEELLARAESILRVRRSGERLLNRAMLAEPAFDLLLCLYVRSGEPETSLSSLARHAGIPYSSALRWIRYLADKGLVLLTQSRSDRRANCVELTRSGRSIMDEMLATR
jgi:DNA-binding MarR family transcriptional regulator